MKPKNLSRFRYVVGVFIRYGFSDVLAALNLRRFGLRKNRGVEPPRAVERARKFRQALEELGATYIKLGQLLSTRPDILPMPYIAELSKLQDRVVAVHFSDVKSVIESESGRRVEDLFQTLDENAVATASVAQVHRARIHPDLPIEGPKEVAVKVLKPGVQEEVTSDLAILQEAAQFVSRSRLGRYHDFPALARELEKVMHAELDLTREATNAERLRVALREFARIRIPATLRELTYRRVLVSEFIHGSRLTDLDGSVNEPALADQLWRAYLKQVLVDGAFHCDPHPGNFLLDRDRNLVLLDHGMVAYLARETRLRLMALVLALVERDGERAAEACLELGIPGEGFRERKFEADVGNMVARYSGMVLAELPLGEIILELVLTAYRNDVQIPPEMMLLGKTLLNLEPICRRFDPQMDPVDTLRVMAATILGEQLASDLKPHRLLSSALELRSVVYDVPSSLRRILARTASNELRLGIRIERSKEMQGAIQKVANRITLGLITAALIVGSALLVNVDAGMKLWGYPVFALVGFVMAAGLGLYMVAKIILLDRI